MQDPVRVEAAEPSLALDHTVTSDLLPVASTRGPGFLQSHPFLRPGVWDALALTFIVVASMIYFWRFVGPGVSGPLVLPPGDLTEQNYAYRHYASIELFEGRLPVWSPYANAGQPFIGDVQTSVFYPPALLLAYLQAMLGQPDLSFLMYEWYIVLHYVVVGFGLYAFVSRGTGNRVAGLVSAMAFSFGGYLTTYPPQQTVILQSATWLPFTLLFLHQAFARGRLGYLFPAAGTIAFAVLGGHPQTFVFYLYLAGAFGLFLVLVPHQPTDKDTAWTSRAPHWATRALGAFGGRPRLTALAFLFLSFLVGLTITAGQLGATTEFWQLSTRATVDARFGQAGFNPDEHTGLLFPDFGGGKPMYVGLATLILAFLALARPRRAHVLFWGIAAAVTFAASFGELTPVYALFRFCLPGYGLFQGQERIIYLTTFAIAVLAGYGAAWLLELRVSRMRWRLAFSLAPLPVLLMALVLATPPVRDAVADSFLPKPATLLTSVPRVPVVLLGSMLILFFAAGRGTRLPPGRVIERLAYGGLALLVPLLAAADNFSVNWTNLVPYPPGLPDVAAPVADFLRHTVRNGRIEANVGMPFGGYYYRLPFLKSEAPLMNRYVATAMHELGFYASGHLFSQRYQVSDGDLPGNELLFQWNGLRVYDLAGVTGRVHVAYRVTAVPKDEDVLRLMKEGMAQGQFSVDRDALTSDGFQSAFEGAGFSRTLNVIDLKPTELLVQVDAAAPALLVLADSYYPGWHAFLDGQSVPIHRTDYALRGVELPAGVHLVSFRYVPRWLQVGLAASGAAMALFVALLALTLARRSRGPLSAIIERRFRIIAWLFPAPWVAMSLVLVVGLFVSATPAIPASLHDATQWEAAYAWAGRQCTAVVDPTGGRAGEGTLAVTAVFQSWSSVRDHAPAGIDRVCVLADVAAGSPAAELVLPAGWQVDEVTWVGTIWVAAYVRQDWLVSQIPFRREASLGSTIGVLGFSWPGARSRGDWLETSVGAWPTSSELFLRADTPTPVDYRLFVQLLDRQGQAVSMSDHYPRDGARPTSTWAAGEIITDRPRLPRPAALEPGLYVLIAGAYDEATGQRLRTPSGEDHVVLARIEVSPPLAVP